MELVYDISNAIAKLLGVGMILYTVLVYMLIFFKKKTWLRVIGTDNGEGMDGFGAFIILILGAVIVIGSLIVPASGVGFSAGSMITFTLVLMCLVYLIAVKIFSWRENIPES